MERRGTRVGNWLTKEQANDLLNAPSPKTLIGKCDRAILAMLIGCGLRRAELFRLDVDHLQQRDARWVIPDLLGKGNRVRTVTIPAGVKARMDLWTSAARISEGRLFRPVTKVGMVLGRGIQDEKAIWRLVVRYARETELGAGTPRSPANLRQALPQGGRRPGADSAAAWACFRPHNRMVPRDGTGNRSCCKRWLGSGSRMS